VRGLWMSGQGKRKQVGLRIGDKMKEGFTTINTINP